MEESNDTKKSVPNQKHLGRLTEPEKEFIRKFSKLTADIIINAYRNKKIDVKTAVKQPKTKQKE